MISLIGAKRQIEILKLFLERESMLWGDVIKETDRHYSNLATPLKALVRDMNHLLSIQAIEVEQVAPKQWMFKLVLSWPTFITETHFFKVVNQFPQGKSYSFLSGH